MTLKLTGRIVEHLKQQPGRKLTARELAEWLFEAHREECEAKRRRSKAVVTPLNTDKALIQQLVAEIGADRPVLQKRHPSLKTTEERPRGYYWSEFSDEQEVAEAETEGTAVAEKSPRKLLEADLYPLLSSYLRQELDVLSMRIDEKASSNSRGPGGNKWLYPDVVGMEDLTAEWDGELNALVREAAGRKARLWSFEVKLLLNRSNVREAYFQAVSNSSWAHYGYLVAAEISGSSTLAELRMLHALHGIGVIRLDADDLAESQILIPARERTEVDWDTCNRLVKENGDFRTYIARIKDFHLTGNPRAKDWDG